MYMMLLILVVDSDNKGDDGEGGSEGRGSIPINL
jgi:hypothetical protein